MQSILVTDKPRAWSFLKSLTQVVETTCYLANQMPYKDQSTHVINVCRSYQYQSIGYYISLLAEARLQEVNPSVMQIQDTLNIHLSKYILQPIDQDIQKAFEHIKDNKISLTIYFGKNIEENHQNIAKKLYDLFPIPLIRIEFIKKRKWIIKTLIPLSIDNIPEHQMKFMQESACYYFNKGKGATLVSSAGTESLRHIPIKKQSTYDLAILVEPAEGETAPSNKKALEKFLAAGEQLGFKVDILTKKNAKNIIEYDALFIRATTSVNHYTYQLARRAAQDNVVVIDDPQSIIKCTNKIFLAELFDKNNILTPPTQFISKYEATLPPIQFPCILKKPDGSCSQGVVKIEDLQSLKQVVQQFFKASDILLIQSFIYTEFDWRIGIIDNKPLYACRYYMAKNHWQIVNWNNDDRLIYDNLLIEEVPEAVINLALKSTSLIGDGLYGVDIKSVGDKHYVIEINDNPSINFGIEDALLKDTLYEKIIDVFLQRLSKKQHDSVSPQT